MEEEPQRQYHGGSQVWPELGLQYATLAKLAMAEGHDEEGVAAAKEALKILYVMLPPSQSYIVEQVEHLQHMASGM